MIKCLFFLLLFFILSFKDIYSLEVDYFDIRQTNDFQFKYIENSFFRIYKLREFGGFSYYLLFSNIDFEANSTCSGICVYLIDYADNRTGQLWLSPFSRLKKAVLRESAISFDVAKVGNNHFYLFVLGQGSELRVYTIRVDGLKREFLKVDPFLKFKISSHVGQVIVPYVLGLSSRERLIDLFYEFEDSKNKMKVVQWYKFDIAEKKFDYVTEVLYDINYEVLGLSYYLINNEPFFIMINRDGIPLLKSRYCEVKIGFVPLIMLKDSPIESSILLLGIDYFHIPGFCSGFFYNVSREFQKLISFCPNIDKIRFFLNKRSQISKLSDVYNFDLTTCNLKEVNENRNKIDLFKFNDSVSFDVLRNLKPIKNVNFDSEVLLYETSLGKDTKRLILRRLIN